jgi:hypothetical protein
LGQLDIGSSRLGLGTDTGQSSVVKLDTGLGQSSVVKLDTGLGQLDIGSGVISSIRDLSVSGMGYLTGPFTSLSTESLPSTSLSTGSSTTTTTVVAPLPTDITGVNLLEAEIPMLCAGGGRRQRVKVGTLPIVGIGRTSPLAQAKRGSGFGYSLRHAPIAIDAIAALNRALGGGRRGGGGARRQRRT